MGAIEALGEKGSHPEGRAEAPHLPLFHSEEMVRWQEFRPLPLLVLCLRSQNSPNTFSLSGDCASWRATLAPDIFIKPGSGSWGVQFLSPPLRWHASLGDELGQSTRSVHRRWCQLRPQVDNQRSLFTGQRHRDNSNPRNWTNNMPRYGRSSNQHLLFSSL